MSDASFDRAALPQPEGISGDQIVDAAGKIVAAVEDLVGGPIYPIHDYLAEVDAQLLRSSWPDAEMLAKMKAAGVECVVNLCSEREQNDEVVQAGMVPANIPLHDNGVPPWGALAAFLSLFRSFDRIAVHCEAGKGRTGCVVAAYRILRCGWTPAAALEEAERFGLAMPCQREWILEPRRRGEP